MLPYLPPVDLLLLIIKISWYQDSMKSRMRILLQPRQIEHRGVSKQYPHAVQDRSMELQADTNAWRGAWLGSGASSNACACALPQHCSAHSMCSGALAPHWRRMSNAEITKMRANIVLLCSTKKRT